MLFFVVKPFGLGAFSDSDMAAFIGRLAFGAMLISVVVTQLIPSRYFNEDHWKVGNQIALTLTNFFLVALFLQYSVLQSISVSTLAVYLGITMLLATGPLAIRILLIQNRVLKTHLEQANLSNQSLKQSEKGNKTTEDDTSLKITADDGEELKIRTVDFCFAKAEKNYIEIYYFSAGKLESHLMRMVFCKLMSQLGDKDIELIQCHRSYIVATNWVSQVLGNSRGYRLAIRNTQQVIPVARSRAKQVLSAL
jgi:hypothetical protein